MRNQAAEAGYNQYLIGILALQGDVEEHEAVLRRLGARVRLVKSGLDLDGLDGLILPGGESTTMGKLLRRFDMLLPLQQAIRQGLPTYGTCAGMILVAEHVLRSGTDQPTLGGMDITVERNAFGSQVESFESELDVVGLEGGPLRAIFIRAPTLRRHGPGVAVLASVADNTPVAARQDHILVTAFHPELTDDDRMHRLFLGMVAEARGNPPAREDGITDRRESPEVVPDLRARVSA